MSFCWSERWSSIGIVLLVLHWLVDKNLVQKIKSIRFDTLYWLSFLFFGMCVIGLFKSIHPSLAWQSVEVKLGFILFPILFATENYLNDHNRNKLLLFFSLSALASISYAFYCSYQENHLEGYSAIVFRMNLSKAIMHPGYYSNYFAWALTWCVLYVITLKRGNLFFALLLLFFSACFSLALIWLVSKTAILYCLFFACYVLWLLSVFIKPMLLRMGIFLLLGFSVFYVATKVPSIKSRLAESNTDYSKIDTSITISNSTGSRIIAWREAWGLIKQKPLLGYGTGNANLFLKEKLTQHGYIQLANYPMHVHNQLLTTWLSIGILGLLLLLILIIYCARIFLLRDDRLGFCLMPFLFLNILTDDMLEIQAGIVFLLFFMYLLFYAPKPSPSKTQAINL
jgi:O-antigen ligase